MSRTISFSYSSLLVLLAALLVSCAPMVHEPRSLREEESNDSIMPFEAKRAIYAKEASVSREEMAANNYTHHLTATVISKNSRSFASFGLNTPDPQREKEYSGSILMLSWALSDLQMHSLLAEHTLNSSSSEPILGYLELDLIYAKQCKEQTRVPLFFQKGTEEIYLPERVLQHKGMLLAYHVTLKSLSGNTILVAPHRLWEELLNIKPLTASKRDL